MVIVREVPAEMVWPLRHKVLRAGQPYESAIFEQDKASASVHYAAFISDHIVGVMSLLPNPPPKTLVSQLPTGMQLRGMATDEAFRGQGVGRALMTKAYEHLLKRPIAGFWCNARLEAASFYSKLGWHIAGQPFHITDIGLHYRMYIHRNDLCRF